MEKKEKVVYIVGAISLDRDYLRKFKEAEEKLREEGYEKIINPICLPENLPYRRYAPISIAFVEASDIVFILSNYNNSVGAQAEVTYAKMAGKEIVYQEETK